METGGNVVAIFITNTAKNEERISISIINQ